MNIGLVVLTNALLVASISGGGLTKQRPALLEPTESNVPLSTLPDLVVVSVDSDNLDNGEVKVKIKNQGLRNAVRSDVVLVMTWGTKSLSFTHSSIPLAAGQMDTVTFDVKMSLVQARFCATADGTKKVNEGDETNNKLCGRFDAKP